MTLSIRRFITRYCLLKVIELGLDEKMAQVILDSLDDREFKEDEENRVLGIVLSGVMLADVD